MACLLTEEIYWESILPLFSPFSAAILSLPRLILSAISYAFLSAGLKYSFPTAWESRQNIFLNTPYNISKLFSSTIISSYPSLEKIIDLGVKINL